MLNLKNDSLRKRYDSIKYDVKKLEEVRPAPASDQPTAQTLPLAGGL